MGVNSTQQDMKCGTRAFRWRGDHTKLEKGITRYDMKGELWWDRSTCKPMIMSLQVNKGKNKINLYPWAKSQIEEEVIILCIIKSNN